MQPPEIEDQRRRDAEIDEIREAVELGAEARGALEHAGDAPVDAVEHGGEHDRRQRPFELVLDRQPDGGQAGAKRQQGDDVGHQRAHRNGAEARRGAACLCDRARRADSSWKEYSRLAWRRAL